MGKMQIKPLGQMTEREAGVVIAETVAAKPKVEIAVETPVVEKVEAPVQEPVVETKAEEHKEEVPVEKPTRKKLKDIAQPFRREAKAEEVKSDELPEPFKLKLSEKDKKIAEVEAKNKEYEAILNDPDNQLWFETRKSGKEIFDILHEVEGINPDTLSQEQLYEISLKSQGLTEEEIQEEIAEFQGLSIGKQKLLTNPVKAKIKADGTTKKEQFLSKLKGNSEKNQVEQQKQLAILEATQKEFNTICDSVVGKTHRGIQFTPEMVQSVKNTVNDGLVDKNPDGSLNAEQLFELAVYRKFAMDNDLLWTELENQITAQAVESLEEKVNVTGASAKASRTPQVTTPTADDTRRSINQTIRPVQGQFGNPSVPRQR